MSSTIINPEKVHLTEKDIEDWLWENPGALVIEDGPVTKWVARQFHVPSGIIDLLGVIEGSDGSEATPVIVEIKNTEITANALTQVSRYAADISTVLEGPKFTYYPPTKVVIGKGKITQELLFEADALGVRLYSFGIKLNIDIGGPWSWNESFLDGFIQQYEQIANDPLLEVFRLNSAKADAETLEVIDEARRIIDEENDEGTHDD